jgi:hypothetical protein
MSKVVLVFYTFVEKKLAGYSLSALGVRHQLFSRKGVWGNRKILLLAVGIK